MHACFHARAINSPHCPTSPVFHTLSRLTLSLCHLTLLPQTSGWFLSRRWEVHRRSHASLPLVRRLIRYIDYLASSSATKDPCTGRISTVGVLQCWLVLKSPSLPVFYNWSTFLEFVDARLLTCIEDLIGLGFNLISVITGLFPLWTYLISIHVSHGLYNLFDCVCVEHTGRWVHRLFPMKSSSTVQLDLFR
jgi:hypothetical protein